MTAAQKIRIGNSLPDIGISLFYLDIEAPFDQSRLLDLSL